jgi:hypothetical protein
MTGTEYAALNAAATCELRACAAQMGTWLLIFLRIALGGWLILAGVWLFMRIAGHRFVTRLALIAVLLISQTVLAQSQPNGKPLSRSTAVDWTTGCTVMPIMAGLILGGGAKGNQVLGHTAACVALGGFVLGPAAGHAYARQADRFIVGVMIRGVSLGLLLSNSTQEGAGILGAAGVFGFLISFGYDIGTVGQSVDKYNHINGFANLHIVPTYSASHQAPGLAIAMSF